MSTIDQTKAVESDMEALKSLGYLNFLEFRPKADWPKTDMLMQEDHYVFFCSVGGVWVKTYAVTPEEAIQSMMVKIGI